MPTASSTSARPALSRLDRQARFALIAAVIMGYAVLFAAEVYSTVHLPGVLLALVFGYVRLYDKKSAIVPDLAWTLLSLLLVAGMMVLSFTGRIYFLDALNWIFLFLPLIKLLTAKAERDYLQLYALAFGQILYGTIVNTDLSFGLILALYLAVTMWGLILLAFRVALHSRPRQAGLLREIETAVFARRYMGLVALLPLVTLLLTFALFFIIPRPGSGIGGINVMIGKRQSGFSDRVDLGQVGEIKLNNAVALRIEANPRTLERPIYWRGTVLDHFNGMTWTASRSRSMRLTPMNPRDPLFIFSDLPESDLSRQRVFLVDMDARHLIHAGFLHRLRIRADHVRFHRNATVSLPPGSRATVESYEVWTHPEPAYVPVGQHLDPYLQLPVGMDPRIMELTRQVTANTRTPLEAARAIEQHLKRQYIYSLKAGLRPSADPMASFLFDTRAGHCEYFASAMTLMLRQLGIHARYVGGFQEGEYNPFENYFMVRHADAHTWPEALIDGTWVAFEPTPEAGLASYTYDMLATLRGLLDALAFRWQRYVVAYSVQDQIGALVRANNEVTLLKQGTISTTVGALLRWLGIAVTLIIVAVIIVRLRHNWPLRRAKHARPRHDLSRRFLRLTRRLARAVGPHRPDETPAEWATRGARRFPQARDAFDTWRRLYEPLRFADHALRPETLAQLDAAEKRLLEEVRRQQRATSPK